MTSIPVIHVNIFLNDFFSVLIAFFSALFRFVAGVNVSSADSHTRVRRAGQLEC